MAKKKTDPSPLDVPEFLLVRNRKPLSPEQREHVRGLMRAAGHVDDNRADYRKPHSLSWKEWDAHLTAQQARIDTRAENRAALRAENRAIAKATGQGRAARVKFVTHRNLVLGMRQKRPEWRGLTRKATAPALEAHGWPKRGGKWLFLPSEVEEAERVIGAWLDLRAGRAKSVAPQGSGGQRGPRGKRGAAAPAGSPEERAVEARAGSADTTDAEAPKERRREQTASRQKKVRR